MRDEKLKRSFAYRSEPLSRHHNAPTFMEFVHRQEERQENHEQERKRLPFYVKSVDKAEEAHAASTTQEPQNIPPVPLIDLADLLLAGMLMFLSITMILLFTN